MPTISHMSPHRISRLKIFGAFVFAGDAHKTHFNLLLEIFDQTLYLFAVLSLGYEKTVNRRHVDLVFLEVCTDLQTEQTSSDVFFEDRLLSLDFLLRLDYEIGVVSFRLGVLFEGVDRPEGLSEVRGKGTCISCRLNEEKARFSTHGALLKTVRG